MIKINRKYIFVFHDYFELAIKKIIYELVQKELMKTLKISFTIVFYCIVLQSKAQYSKTLSNAFSQSYDFEAINNYDAAIVTLDAVYNVNSYEVNLRLGWLNFKIGKHQQAVAYYQKATALMPAATETYWGIINPLIKLENWSEVEKVYGNILKLDPKNQKANYGIGLINYYRKDYINAKKYFDICLNLSPFGYNNMLMSAWTNYYLGNKNESFILFNKTTL